MCFRWDIKDASIAVTKHERTHGDIVSQGTEPVSCLSLSLRLWDDDEHDYLGGLQLFQWYSANGWVDDEAGGYSEDSSP